MMDNNGPLLFENSIKYLTFQQVWPKNKEELYQNNGIMFYLKYILIAFSISTVIWGSLAHIIMAAYGENESQIYWDISIIISIIGTCYFNFSYLVNIKRVTKAVNDLTDFEKFGKPPGIFNFNKKLNKYAKWHQIYISTIIVIISMARTLELKACVASNVEQGKDDVCGLVANIWVPFDVDFFPVKQIIFLTQVCSLYFAYVPASTISFFIVESMGHVIFRLAHVRALFVEAMNEKSIAQRRPLMRRCIDYHNFVIRLAQALSESYSACVFVHVLLTGAVLGCNLFQILQNPHLNTIALSIGWLLALLMAAIVGQQLIDECFMFSDAIYDTKWYDVEIETQKDLLLVLLRSKKFIYIKAGPFGCMSHQIVVSILKTAYSIVSLMKATS